MNEDFSILELGQAGMIAAAVMVFLRWVWLQLRMSNVALFMAQIAKLLEAGNVDRAIRLAAVLPSDPVGVGTLAVLRAHGAGRRMNETQLVNTFNAALPGGDVREALGRFRMLKTASFAVAITSMILYANGSPASFSTAFWGLLGGWTLLFLTTSLKERRLEHETNEAVGVLMRLVAEPDEDDPGVDAEEDDDGDRVRGEGHLGIREAWEDADARVEELTASGVEDLLLATFRREHGINLRHDGNAMKRIGDAARKAVVELSSVPETEVSLPFITADGDGPKHLEATVNRKKALVFSHRARETEADRPGRREPREAPRLGEVNIFAPEPFQEPAPAEVPAPQFGEVNNSAPEPSALAEAPPSGKAVVCRSCATLIPVEPEILATIEGEFDLWTKVKARCPKCGGSFLELVK